MRYASTYSFAAILICISGFAEDDGLLEDPKKKADSLLADYAIDRESIPRNYAVYSHSDFLAVHQRQNKPVHSFDNEFQSLEAHSVGKQADQSRLLYVREQIRYSDTGEASNTWYQYLANADGRSKRLGTPVRPRANLWGPVDTSEEDPDEEVDRYQFYKTSLDTYYLPIVHVNRLGSSAEFVGAYRRSLRFPNQAERCPPEIGQTSRMRDFQGIGSCVQWVFAMEVING